MLYSEASYFDGYHFAHIAKYLDHLRILRLQEKMQSAR